MGLHGKERKCCLITKSWDFQYVQAVGTVGGIHDELSGPQTFTGPWWRILTQTSSGEVWHLRRILSHSASPCKTCVICWGWEDIREKRTRKVKQNPGTRQLLAMRRLLETDTGRPSHSQPPRPQGNSYRGKPDATCCQHLPGVAETLR